MAGYAMKREASMKRPLQALRTMKEISLSLGMGFTFGIMREKTDFGTFNHIFDLEPVKLFGVSQATIY